MNPHQEANRRRWDELVPIHAASAFYDVVAFKSGRCTLRSIELAELGDVAGKSLLHLQCHFGLDTLSWARRGARVTGVDYSEVAIAQASALAAENGVEATFVCSRVEDLPTVLHGKFDIVFTSYGVLCWLPELKPWANTIAHCLKPGGVFYMVEIHPFVDVLDDSAGVTELSIRYPYFHHAEPLAWDAVGTYADRSATVVNKISHVWSHGLGEIVSALLDEGLRLEYLHEWPECIVQRFPFMIRDADGWWRFPARMPVLPQMFSLRAKNG